ncbi:MAG: MobQ family relaxase [Caldilineaceae bacterium]
MPNPHFDVQIISRGSGRSAVAASSYRSGSRVSARSGPKSVVAAASYRSGERLHDRQADKTFDYTRKEDVLYSEIRLPASAPDWAANREALWNQVETVEKRKDAQLARDIIAALPRELDKMQQIALVQEFIDSHFTTRGMIADWALHTKVSSDGGQNPHVHIMLTLREVNEEGFGKKNRDWNQQTLVTDWRDAWAALSNRYLEGVGSDARLDLRSYQEQGIDRTPQQHMGYDNWHKEERGVETETGDFNRRAHHENSLRDVARVIYEAPELELPEQPVELTSDAAHLRAVSREIPSSDDGAVAADPHLRAVAGQLEDNRNDSPAGRMDAAKRTHAESMMSRTVQSSLAIAERAARQAREWMAKAKAWLHSEREKGTIFDRFADLRDLSREQRRQQDQDHER